MTTRYALTNTSDWLFPTNPVLAANSQHRVEDNRKIMNLFFKSEDKLKVRRMCFDQCVNDFSATNYNNSESACMRNCVSQSEQLLTDFSFSTDKYKA
jgi:hypothetical protein